jgi:hypothetical protein
MKRQVPEVGSIFLVPLPDNTWAVGQIVGREAEVLNSWTCAFSRARIGKEEVATEALRSDEIVSVQFVTGDLLKSGDWRIVGRTRVLLPASAFPYQSLRCSGWIGARVIGSRIIQRFLAAFHGLAFWDEMKDPDYYQKLLRPGVVIPDDIRRKSA